MTSQLYPCKKCGGSGEVQAYVHGEMPWRGPCPDCQPPSAARPHGEAEPRGIYRKFDVRRMDGRDKPGGKHHGCRYFVLDVDHDEHALAALQAYRDDCRDARPGLADDIDEMLDAEAGWLVPEFAPDCAADVLSAKMGAPHGEAERDQLRERLAAYERVVAEVADNTGALRVLDEQPDIEGERTIYVSAASLRLARSLLEQPAAGEENDNG